MESIGVDATGKIVIAPQWRGDPRPPFAFQTTNGGSCCCPPPSMTCGCKNWDAQDLLLDTEFAINSSNVATGLNLGTPLHSTIEFLPRFADWKTNELYAEAARAFTTGEQDTIGRVWPMTWQPEAGTFSVRGVDSAPGQPISTYIVHGITERPRWRYEDAIDTTWDVVESSTVTATVPVRITKTATLWLSVNGGTLYDSHNWPSDTPFVELVGSTYVQTCKVRVYTPERTNTVAEDVIVSSLPPSPAYEVTSRRVDACAQSLNSPNAAFWATLRVKETVAPFRCLASVSLWLGNIRCGLVSSNPALVPDLGYFPFRYANKASGREWTYLRGA